MKINIKLVNDFKKSISKLLAVTKYWNTEETKEIKYIVKHSSTIHSLYNLNHIEKIDEVCEEQSTDSEIKRRLEFGDLVKDEY